MLSLVRVQAHVARTRLPASASRLLATKPPTDGHELNANVVHPSQVSSPHPVSNLRRVQPPLYHDETPAEARLRVKLEQDAEFHHSFWAANNTEFKTEKAAFVSAYYKENPSAKESGQPIPAHVMSDFYRGFLDARKDKHRTYNLTWWGRSFAQMPLYAAAYASRCWQSVVARASPKQ